MISRTATVQSQDLCYSDKTLVSRCLRLLEVWYYQQQPEIEKNKIEELVIQKLTIVRNSNFRINSKLKFQFEMYQKFKNHFVFSSLTSCFYAFLYPFKIIKGLQNEVIW